MKHGKNINTFYAFLRLKAVKTNHTADGIFARNVLKKFKHHGIKLMRKENVGCILLDELEEIFAAFRASCRYVRVDRMIESQRDSIGNGCHVRRVHLGFSNK